jgi:DNA-binding MurR/RpiR family transcriptional regulator
MKSAASKVLIKLDTLAKGLSPVERRVASYIRRNPARVPFQSVQEVARAAKVSVASVSRLARVAGYASFKDLKIGLAQETASPVSAVFQTITANDSNEAVLRKVFGGNIQSLQNTLKMLKISDCLRAVKLIAGAKRVVFFGIGSSGFVAHEAALRLSHLDIHTESYVDSYQMLVRAAQMRKGEVAIGISHSGRSAATVEAVRCAASSGATTIGISNYVQSPLHKVSSIFFCTSFEESGVKAASLSAAVAQMSLLDALYVLVARYERNTAKVERINRVVENFLRLPEKKR